MARDTVRVGIVGAGWMGVVHATGWQSNTPRGEIAAVADVSEDRARHIVNRFASGRAKIYPDLDALLADPSIDAVDICLPHHLHTDAILKAAAAKKAILCEKPICLSLDDAARIKSALAETGTIFQAAHNQLFQPSLIEARRLLDDGALGRVFVIRSIEAGQNRGFKTGRPPIEMGAGDSSWGWRSDPSKSGGGEVLDTGWHGTYRLLALANDRPVEVTAMTGQYFVKQIDVEDTGLILIRFASGIIGEIVTSWAFGLASGWQFEVAGEHGSLAGNARRLIHQLTGWAQPAERANEPVVTYTREITHFIDVLLRGEPVAAGVDQAIRVLQLIRGAYRSAEERRTISLPEDPTQL
ncbi:MAG TPA: Gfo/Idh/MocA family oxidoreductase [Chloroflexota bacterium]|nr:Gfo/Idh/MocA family oxidoreductase [Chloroflexota bacterium]